MAQRIGQGVVRKINGIIRSVADFYDVRKARHISNTVTSIVRDSFANEHTAARTKQAYRLAASVLLHNTPCSGILKIRFVFTEGGDFHALNLYTLRIKEI